MADSIYLNKHAAVRAVVGVVCLFSMLGSVLIVISYCCFKQLRSEARTILLNLSLMDFGVGLANFVGIVVYFDQYYKDSTATAATAELLPNVSSVVDDLCKAQAFLAAFCTYASVFWTITLAFYMHMFVFASWEKTRWYIYFTVYPFNYVLSALLCVWFMWTKRLGHAPYNSSGWCSLINVNSDYIATIIGYDLWIYLGMVMCTTVYVSIFFYLHTDPRRKMYGNYNYWKKALQMLDFRIVFIPAFFILFRMGTCITNILFTYVGVNPDKLPSRVQLALIILSGIGDSGQGAANGILFVVFTKVFWVKITTNAVNLCKYCKRQRMQPAHSYNSGRTYENMHVNDEETTQD